MILSSDTLSLIVKCQQLSGEISVVRFSLQGFRRPIPHAGKRVYWGQSMVSPTLPKPEGFRIKWSTKEKLQMEASSRKAGASEGEGVVLYFEPSATPNLKSSGFPAGQTTWQNRPHPSNSPMEVSGNLSYVYDFGNN
jgi:hypothetical protein